MENHTRRTEQMTEYTTVKTTISEVISKRDLRYKVFRLIKKILNPVFNLFGYKLEITVNIINEDLMKHLKESIEKCKTMGIPKAVLERTIKDIAKKEGYRIQGIEDMIKEAYAIQK